MGRTIIYILVHSGESSPRPAKVERQRRAVSQEQLLLEAPPLSPIGWGRNGRRGPAVGRGIQRPLRCCPRSSLFPEGQAWGARSPGGQGVVQRQDI